MPKVVEKHRVLGTNGDVVLYGSGTSAGRYFYREWNRDTKTYRTQLLDANCLDDAIAIAVSVSYRWKEERPTSTTDYAADSKKRNYSLQTQRQATKVSNHYPTIVVAAQDWVSKAEEALDKGLIAKNTYIHKERTFRLYVVPYLTSIGIYKTDQIDGNTFTDYLTYRATSTALVRQRELSIIKDWVYNHLVPHKLLVETPAKSWFPYQKIRQTDRLKNPAINPQDWNTIITFVRNDWRNHLKLTGHQNHRSFYWRDLFWHFLLVSKNSGMSPEEILKLRWKDVEIRDVGRIDSKGVRQEWFVAYIRTIRSKTQQAREIPTNLGRELQRWMSIVKEYCDTQDLPHPVANSCVFGKPNEGFCSYSYGMFKQAWVEVRNSVEDKLKGHRFSPHPYTIYSLRSTFIENHLLKGTDLFLLARMAGHDVKELMKSYERLDIRQRAKEITAIQFGKKRGGVFGRAVG
jgi:integrase